MTQSLPHNQPADAHHLRVGDVVVTTLFDTSMVGSLELIQGLDSQTTADLHEASRRASPPHITVNAYLIRTPDANILVDAGLGPNADEHGGRALKAIGDAGLVASDIDTVLLTHVHPDHFGGLVDGDGNPTLPGARIHIPGGEIDYWQAGPPADAGDVLRGHFDGAQAFLAACDDQIERLDGEAVAAGITRVSLPGHTPDHSGYRIESAGEQLLIWADIVHMPQIQFARPEACVAFDVDPDLAARTRKTLLREVAESGQLIAGHHLDFPGIGHVQVDGDGYKFQPHVWSAVV